jgi:hypothetical protein
VVIEVGKHRLMIGDITTGAVSQLMGAELADVLYSDPPWGAGNQQYWHTMRERGAKPRTSWEEFLDAFAGVAMTHTKPEAPVFIEMGCRWADQLVDTMTARGFERVKCWMMTYGPRSKPLPVTLNLFGRPEAMARLQTLAQKIDSEWPAVPHGEPVTKHVLSCCVQPNHLVLDPCTGLGMTARWAHKLGASFRGTEMNEKRLERTATWLRSKCR